MSHEEFNEVIERVGRENPIQPTPHIEPEQLSSEGQRVYAQINESMRSATELREQYVRDGFVLPRSIEPIRESCIKIASELDTLSGEEKELLRRALYGVFNILELIENPKGQKVAEIAPIKEPHKYKWRQYANPPGKPYKK